MSFLKDLSIKRLLRLFGNILVLLSIWFLVKLFSEKISEIRYLDLSISNFLLLLFLVLNGVFAYWVLSYIWKLQLGSKYTEFTLRKSFRIIALTQIAKYVPGNIAHVVGRFYLSQKILKKSDAAYSIFIENIMFIISASMIGAIYFFFYDVDNIIEINLVWILPTLIVCLLIVMKFFLSYIRAKYDVIKPQFSIFIKVFFVFVFLHLLGGVTIFVLINLITPELGTPFLLCISGYAISFMIGFITPGAPGGIGVREFAFTQLFTPFIGAIYALEVILLFRIITILSDLMLFVIGKYFIGKSEKENFTYI